MKISQREARRLRRRVAELEHAEQVRRRRWGADWPGGIEISRVSLEHFPAIVSAIHTARKLEHAVVAVSDGNEVRFVALKHPDVKAI